MPALVSVIIPTYNRARQLLASVETVLTQTYRPIQLILVNDGSRDETPAVMASLEQKAHVAGVEPTFLSQANAGVSAARNAGLRVARGEFIAFHDDDDVWYPHKLQRQLQAIAQTGADACSCMTVNSSTNETVPRDPAKLFSGRDPGAYLRAETECQIIALVFAARLLPRIGEFELTLQGSEDTEWKIRLLHEATFCAVPEVLASFSITPGSLSRYSGYEGLIRRDRTWERVLMLARERCKDRPGWDELNWRSVAAKAFSEYVKHFLYGGEIAKARELWQRGMELTHGQVPLPRLKRKLFKAWLLALFGLRIKHPKLKNIEDFAA